MQIGHIELPIRDPAASLAFYEGVLGFRLEANQGGRFLWLSSGDVVMLLRPGPPRSAGGQDDSPNVVLYTEDLEGALARLVAAGVPTTLRGTCHYFQDPDGHWLQLVNPGDDHSQG